MGKNSGFSLCILCCRSFPNSPTDSPATTETVQIVNKFIEHTGVVNRKCLSSGGLVGLGQLSICGECLSGVRNAVEKKSQVEEVEGKLRSLQKQILRLKGELGNLMEGQLEGMRGLEGKIKKGDEGCLRVIAGMAGQRKKEEDAWTWDDVFQFRDGILKVTNNLRDDLTKRDAIGGHDDELVPEASLKRTLSAVVGPLKPTKFEETVVAGNFCLEVDQESSVENLEEPSADQHQNSDGNSLEIDVNRNSEISGDDSEEMRNMNYLCRLLEECIEGCLLPFLPWNDLLRFRRVCKFLHQVTTKYMQVHPELAPEIEINEKDRSFGAFLQMNIPTNKFFFNNVSGLDFYKNDTENMTKFKEKYCSVMTSLRLKQISFLLQLQLEDGKFIRSCSQLQNLEAECYDMESFDLDPKVVYIHYLSFLEHLETVKFGQNLDQLPNGALHQTLFFLDFCKKLRYVSLPFHPYPTNYFDMNGELSGIPNDRGSGLLYAFAMVHHYFNEKEQEYPGNRIFDFACYHDIEKQVGNPDEVLLVTVPRGSPQFLRLCKGCNLNNFKLLNVNAFWFMERFNLPELNTPEIGNAVISMINLHPSVLCLEMANLERLEIKAMAECRLPSEAHEDWRVNWPSLKSLDLTVECNGVNKVIRDGRTGITYHHIVKTKYIFGFCFKNIVRLAMTELCMKFDPAKENLELAIPKADDIVSSCPNLKRLTLVNWQGTNKSLLKLWEGLPGLEEISLEKCRNVGNVTFVGLDTKNPVFFKLKNLRKLSLKGLDQMPKITDLLFTMVISQLNLNHFVITSDNPVESVTLNGIRSLLRGKFAASIEKFQFKQWSLANVSEDEFQQIETEFRSYQMI